MTFRVLPDVGHVPMSDDPKLVGETIVEWVERSRAASADSSAGEPEREPAAA